MALQHMITTCCKCHWQGCSWHIISRDPQLSDPSFQDFFQNYQIIYDSHQQREVEQRIKDPVRANTFLFRFTLPLKSTSSTSVKLIFAQVPDMPARCVNVNVAPDIVTKTSWWGANAKKRRFMMVTISIITKIRRALQKSKRLQFFSQYCMLDATAKFYHTFLRINGDVTKTSKKSY